MRQLLAFSWRGFRREWRAGELRVLALALVVAVAAVSAVGLFTDRTRLAMEHQAAELLAADLVVDANHPIDPAWMAAARSDGLQTAQTVEFRSVVLAGEKLQLAEVKAVSAAYPLRGRVRLAQHAFGPDRAVPPGGPAPGTVWLAPALLRDLGVAPGDEVALGNSRLKIAAVLSYEPDRGGDLFSIAPRLMMNLQDLPATGLIQTGSLVRYKLLLAGSDRQVAQYRRGLRPQLKPGERLLGVRDARPQLRQALTRAQRFLGLAALVSVLLAGVAVATAARRYTRRHLDGVAILRCLGAGQRFIVASFGLRLLWLGLGASLAGLAVGFGAQAVLVALLGDLFANSLPPPSWLPALQGLGIGLVTLAGFALPPVLALRGVPPLRVLRHELAPLAPRALGVYGAALAALLLLTAWEAREITLVLYVFAGALATVAVLALVAALLVASLRLLRGRVGVAWRFGVANITRRPRASVVQVIAFGVGIMALLLLALVRTDLLQGWRETLPADAPNRFLINVQPEQVAPLQRFFAARRLPPPQLYPMVRGRLVAINGKPVSAQDYPDTRAKRLITREFNLSWLARPMADNEVTAGRFWSGKAPAQWSVEEGIAKTLGIHLGDTLRYRIGGDEVEAKVTSLRKVDWGSFHVNFFVVAPPGALNRFPASYITSFHLGENHGDLLAALVRQFPNVTVIDVAAIMAHVRAIIDRVSLGVEFVFGFTLLAGVMVLFAAIQSTHDERVREGAVLRTLGAGRRRVQAGFAAEFLTLGLLAGTLAALASTLLAYVLAVHVFQLEYHFNPWVWVWGIGGGAVLVGVAGLIGTRGVLARPPLQVLQQP